MGDRETLEVCQPQVRLVGLKTALVNWRGR